MNLMRLMMEGPSEEAFHNVLMILMMPFVTDDVISKLLAKVGDIIKDENLDNVTGEVRAFSAR